MNDNIAGTETRSTKTTTTLFGEPVTTTKTGALFITSVEALLTRRRDLICTLTGEFNGQTDSIERQERRVDTAWVIRTIIDSGLRRTRNAYVSKRLGAQVLMMGNPSYDVLVTDHEHPAAKQRSTLFPPSARRALQRFKLRLA